MLAAEHKCITFAPCLFAIKRFPGEATSHCPLSIHGSLPALPVYMLPIEQPYNQLNICRPWGSLGRLHSIQGDIGTPEKGFKNAPDPKKPPSEPVPKPP